MKVQILSEADYTKQKEEIATALIQQNIEVARLVIESMNPDLNKQEVIDKLLEREKTIEEIYMSEGFLSWNRELNLGDTDELTTVYFSLFNINIGLLSTMNKKYARTYIGCYKRDSDIYVLFETPIETNEGEEGREVYQRAIVKTMRVFNF